MVAHLAAPKSLVRAIPPASIEYRDLADPLLAPGVTDVVDAVEITSADRAGHRVPDEGTSYVRAGTSGAA